MPSVDCYTDHRLVRCKVAFAFKSPPKRKGPKTEKLQVHKFRGPGMKISMRNSGSRRRPYYRKPRAEVVGLSTRKHQDWFDETDKEIQELLEKKRSRDNYQFEKPDDQAAKAAYKTVCSTLQAKIRTMQNDRWTGLAERT